ncbi:hypothetical protein CNMCM7691_004831 [Aspergillus felis]|uniref:Uncharacterized protein n=1 Tax=Aspergillus felis TaxID=1287682 RepID=A0A8H6R648_9EURO|nr:hypothetical protein CNMCM7691_004831 [Aspergillus felis]
MNTDQKRSYLVYSRGLKAEDLRLGSLYVDPANPLDNWEQKAYICPLEDQDLAARTGPLEHDTDCIFNLRASHDWLIGANALQLLDLEIRRDGESQIRIEAKSGRRAQIKRPEAFLNEIILPHPEAQAWLSRQLSVSRMMYYLSRMHFSSARFPSVWLLTGIQYLSGVRLAAGWSRNTRRSLALTMPVPDPTVAVLTGLDGFGARGSVGGREAAEVHFGHSDERIWAAQFVRLKVEYYPLGQEEKSPLKKERILLHSLKDLGMAGVRGDEEEVEETSVLVSGLSTDDDDMAHLAETTQSLDWDIFEDLLGRVSANG